MKIRGAARCAAGLLILLLLGCDLPGATPAPPTPTAIPWPTAAPSPTPGATPAPPEMLAVEDVTLTGSVELPAESALPLAEMRLVTNRGTVAPAADGGFTAPAMRGADNATLALLTNAAGNPVLLRATRGAATLAPGAVSITSTARALILFDPAVLALPPDQQDRAATLAAADPGLPALEAAVRAALLADPADPLNADLHPDPYRLSGQIVAGLLAQLDATGRAPAVGGRALAPALVAAAPLPGSDYVYVTDDPDHNTPEVLLNNASFAYYKVTVQRDGVEWGRFVLNRNKPYSALFHWPPAYVVSQSIAPGDGELAFTFEKYSRMTIYDMIWTVMMQATGIPAANAATLEADLGLLLTAQTEAGRVARDLVTLLERSQGKTAQQIGTDVCKFLGAHGVILALAVATIQGRHLAKAAGQQYVSLIGRYIGQKAAWAAIIGYVAADLAWMGWSVANAPALVTVPAARQQAGIYPAVTLSVTSTAPAEIQPGQSYVLDVRAANIPEVFHDVEVYVEAGDQPVKEIDSQEEGGLIALQVKREYAGEPEVRVYLMAAATGRQLAAATVPLGPGPRPTALPGGSWVRTNTVSTDTTPGPDDAPDPGCYARPLFEPDSYRETAGCAERGSGANRRPAFEVTYAAHWTVPPATLLPGHPLTLALETSTTASDNLHHPCISMQVWVPSWHVEPAAEPTYVGPENNFAVVYLKGTGGAKEITFRPDAPVVAGAVARIQISVNVYECGTGYYGADKAFRVYEYTSQRP